MARCRHWLATGVSEALMANLPVDFIGIVVRHNDAYRGLDAFFDAGALPVQLIKTASWHKKKLIA